MIDQTDRQNRPPRPPELQKRRRFRLQGLQIRMTVTYIKVTFGIIFIIQIFRLLLFIPLRESWKDLIVPFFVDVSALVIIPLIAGIFGFIATRGLIRRLRLLVSATMKFAQGDYQQHVQVHEGDEVGQLEEHFNQMADQLATNTAQLRLLTEQNARLAERTRIARDLHDSVKQQVFAIGMQVGTALSLLDQDTEATRQHMQETDALVYQVQLELTALIQELRPSHLQEKGLAQALNDYVIAWSRRQAINTDCTIDPSCTLPEPLEETLWRIAQEALSNIARHSHASLAQVSLKQETEQIRLEISDNGCGFPLDTIKAGMGLQSIRERAQASGGTIEIHSQPGAGTTLVISLPQQQRKAYYYCHAPER